MKNLVLVTVFVCITILSVFGIPAILESALGVEQPLLTVTSGSMWPELSRGDIVFVKKTGIEDIEVGSVIVFHHEHGLAVHRVIQIRGTTLTTKGDANPLADNPINYDDVVGRIPTIGSKLVKLPWVGHFSLFEETEESTTTLESTEEPSFWHQFGEVVLKPVSITVLIVTTLVILFYDRIFKAMNSLIPLSVRKRRLKARTRRLPARSR